MPGHAFSSLILSASLPLAAIQLDARLPWAFSPLRHTSIQSRRDEVSGAQTRISGLLGGDISNESRVQRGLQNQPRLLPAFRRKSGSGILVEVDRTTLLTC